MAVAVDHHLQVDGRPTPTVAVGDGQPGHGGRQSEPLRRPPGGALGGDLADAVRAEERPHAVVVPELVLLGEHMVAEWFVDAGGRAVDEGLGVLVVLHQPGQAAAVGLEVEVPVVGLGHGEVDDVVGVGREAADIAAGQIDRHAAHPGRFEPGPGRRVLEPGRPHHLVVPGQGHGDRLGHLAGDSGDDDRLALEGCGRHARSPSGGGCRDGGTEPTGGRPGPRGRLPDRSGRGRPQDPAQAGPFPGNGATDVDIAALAEPYCLFRLLSPADRVFPGHRSDHEAVRPVIPTVTRK